MVSLEQMREEATRRLKRLKVLGEVVDAFTNEGVVCRSERQSAFFDGILYRVEKGDRFGTDEIIDRFQRKYGYLVYHVQWCNTSIGAMLTLLFVSNKKSYWKEEFYDAEYGFDAYAYVENLDDENCSEFGYVGITPRNGGISRIA